MFIAGHFGGQDTGPPDGPVPPANFASNNTAAPAAASMDINSLFSKLLAAGIINKPVAAIVTAEKPDAASDTSAKQVRLMSV